MRVSRGLKRYLVPYLAIPKESGFAFGALTNGEKLQAVRLPLGGYREFNIPVGGVYRNVGSDLWEASSGQQLKANIQLISCKSGPEMHVIPEGSQIKSIH